MSRGSSQRQEQVTEWQAKEVVEGKEMSALSDQLDQECQALNDRYAELGRDAWAAEFKKLADRAWVMFGDESVTGDQTFTAVVARCIIFWDSVQKELAIIRMWKVALASNDHTVQNRLCSIITVVANGFSHDHMCKLFSADIKNLSKLKSYGIYMVELMRRFEQP